VIALHGLATAIGYIVQATETVVNFVQIYMQYMTILIMIMEYLDMSDRRFRKRFAVCS